MNPHFAQADALRLPLADKSIDPVIGSPPYLDARRYGRRDIARPLDQWVAFMLGVSTESVRVCRGLVLWVVAGTTRDGGYQPGPEALLSAWVAQWFIGGWCPPGGVVLDPFSGSGTTCAAAVAMGRRGIGLDIRFGQCERGRRRCAHKGAA